MKRRPRAFRSACPLSACPLLVAAVALWSAAYAQSADHGKVELIRDKWGVPHLFADTDAGAMYGLGYATAEDRAFQMTYSLRIIQGRLSEVIGVVQKRNRKDTSLDSDKKMRTFGFYRAAQKVVASLDAETKALLQAYCDGVNDYFAKNAGNLHYLFAKYDVKPEPWTPADCLASWWHMAQFFATDGTRDLIARRNALDPNREQRRMAAIRQARGGGRGGRGGGRQARRPADLEKLPPDDGPAVVKREDLSQEWIDRVNEFAKQHGMIEEGAAPQPAPKFSHAWAVGGKLTTTGSSVLVSDPQTPVRNPSLFYEAHVKGKTFNARGIGVPGSPIILIGFTDRVAWGCTALGADQADLFLLKMDREHPNQYFFDGEWKDMEVRQETIKVRGGDPVEYTVRETHLGPVATQFCFAQRGEQVALKRIPVCETDRETVQSALAMWRAKNATEFLEALHGWRFPSCNMLFGDAEGNVGYQALVAAPIRSKDAIQFGRGAIEANSPEDDWQGFVPYDLLPQVINPKRGYVYSGNHRAIESWYPISFGNVTGSGGDTERSWRLRERLEAKDRFSPEEILDIHFDSTNPARREIVRIGLHLRDVLKRALSAETLEALDYLEPWYKAGAKSDLGSVGAEVAGELNTFFRFVNTDLAFMYGGGQSGLAYCFKTIGARIDADPKADITRLEQAYVDKTLANAWRQAGQKYGRGGDDPTRWNDRAKTQVTLRNLGYFESLDGFPSLDPAHDLKFPAITDVDGGTINCQSAQSYTQYVPMHDPDAAMSINPIGQSERLESPFRTCNMELWAQNELHPAPLSREAVERIAMSRTVLGD